LGGVIGWVSVNKEQEELLHLYMQFEEEHESLRQELIADLNKLLRPEPPEELFHYTSSAMEIIDSNRIHATNLKYTNDYTELYHGHKLAQEVRQELLSNAKSAIATEFLGKVAENALSFVGQKAEVYGFSLSEVKNSLPQWRSYAGEGTGQMIGFDSDLLEQRLNPPGGRVIEVMLLKVCYEEGLQREALKGVIGKIAQCVDSDQSRYERGPNLVWHASLLGGRAAPYIVSLKNKPFDTEKEWRLVGVDYLMPITEEYGAIQFRRSGTQIVPYVECYPKKAEDPNNTSLLPIRSVEVGPQADETLGKHAMELLLAERGYRNQVSVSKCPTPFRTF